VVLGLGIYQINRPARKAGEKTSPDGEE